MHLQKPDTRMVDVDSLNVSEEYQREMIVPHVNEMERNFDPEAFGLPLAGERDNGSLWLVDGFQRVSMARKLGIKRVPCEVVRSRGVAHEASLFRKRARRRNLSACQLFKALVAEGNDEAGQILAVVNDVGLNVAGMADVKRGGSIGCIKACRDAFKLGGADHLCLVLTTLKRAWADGHENAYHQAMVGGLSLFLFRYDGEVDVRRLTSRMASQSPAHVLGQAQPFKLLSGGSRVQAVGHAFKGFYDIGLRKKLPEWQQPAEQLEVEEAVS